MDLPWNYAMQGAIVGVKRRFLGSAMTMTIDWISNSNPEFAIA
jgi:hypothetical protein